MANKNDNDMQRMRQDAIRRSQEMYQRAQTAPPGYTGNAFSETSASPHKPHKPSDKPPAKKVKNRPLPNCRHFGMRFLQTKNGICY